jgi:hypothetical protein
MSRIAAAFTGRFAAVPCAEWLSEDWLHCVCGSLIDAGSQPPGRPHLSPRPFGVRRPYADDRPRGPPKSAGPEWTRPSDVRSNRNDRDDDVNKSVAPRQPWVLSA